MNTAFLFNSDHPMYSGYYGHPIHKRVFQSEILQNSKRHMKVSVGDVLIYTLTRSKEDYDFLTNKTYFFSGWSSLLVGKLKKTFVNETVYSLVFENMTNEIAINLHDELISDDSYLGCLEVDFSYGPHLRFFRNAMVSKYRIEGRTCRIFYSMGEEEGERDVSEIDDMLEFGFTDVDWEDLGAHKTIFDDFDTLGHFERVATFKKIADASMPKDDTSELIMILEDLNPKLFDSLGAAAQALSRSKTSEDVAQAALSGRRYLEQLADVLFPPREAKYNNRKVGKLEYRNRLWAYISDKKEADDDLVKDLGRAVDRLVEEFNAGLHSERTKKDIEKSLAGAGTLTVALLLLDPVSARKPYYAHQKRIDEFYEGLLEDFAKKRV